MRIDIFSSKRQYYLAVDMLRQFTEVESDSSWSLVHAICSRVVGDEISRAKVYQHAGQYVQHELYIQYIPEGY